MDTFPLLYTQEKFSTFGQPFHPLHLSIYYITAVYVLTSCTDKLFPTEFSLFPLVPAHVQFPPSHYLFSIAQPFHRRTLLLSTYCLSSEFVLFVITPLLPPYCFPFCIYHPCNQLWYCHFTVSSPQLAAHFITSVAAELLQVNTSHYSRFVSTSIQDNDPRRPIHISYQSRQFEFSFSFVTTALLSFCNLYNCWIWPRFLTFLHQFLTSATLSVVVRKLDNSSTKGEDVCIVFIEIRMTLFSKNLEQLCALYVTSTHHSRISDLKFHGIYSSHQCSYTLTVVRQTPHAEDFWHLESSADIWKPENRLQRF